MPCILLILTHLNVGAVSNDHFDTAPFQIKMFGGDKKALGATLSRDSWNPVSDYRLSEIKISSVEDIIYGMPVLVRDVYGSGRR